MKVSNIRSTMSILKTTFIACGLLCLVLKIQGSALPSFTKQWNANYTYSPKVVKVNGHILIVGLEDNTIIVNSTFDGNQSNVCNHDGLSPAQHALNYAIVTALGNGKIVIQYQISASDKLQLLILDPFDCSTIRKVELNNNYEALVPYQDSFDVFYREYKDYPKKSPQRYNDKGEQLKVDDFIDLGNQSHIIILETIEHYDASKGYVSHMYLPEKGHVLKLLNSRFEILKEVVLENHITSLSVTYGKINYCYTKERLSPTLNLEVCKFLDAEFKSKATVESQKPIEIVKSVLTNLPDGGVLLRTVYAYIDNHLIEINVQHINADGSKREPVKIFARELVFNRVMQTILMDNGEVCFANGGLIYRHYRDPVYRTTQEYYGIWIDCVQISNL